MNLTRQPISRDQLGIGHSYMERASGVHASDLFNGLYKDHLQPNKFKNDLTEYDLNAYAEVGVVWEMMLKEGMARRIAEHPAEHEQIITPDESTWEGEFEGHRLVIHYNPDLHIYNDHFRIGEVKSTWKWTGVSNEVVNAAWEGDPEAFEQVAEAIRAEKFDKYFAQMKLYTYFEKTPYARLYVLGVVGNGRPPVPHILPPIDIEFDIDEQEQNAAMCFYYGIQQGWFEVL